MPFVKGKSGNPEGRRLEQKRSWDAVLRRAALRNDAEALNKVAEALIAKGIEGDVPAIREIGDRLDGKVPQAITGPEGGPLQVQDVPWIKGRSLARR